MEGGNYMFVSSGRSLGGGGGGTQTCTLYSVNNKSHQTALWIDRPELKTVL